LPKEVNSGDLYILDFSIPPEHLVNIVERFDKVVLLDHHKTAKEDYKSYMLGLHKYDHVHIAFDLEESGATLTNKVLLKNFYPNSFVLDYLKSYDLFTFT